MSGDNRSRKNKRKGQKHIEMDSLQQKFQFKLELMIDLKLFWIRIHERKI
jgi:hypothetical protein